MCHVISFMNEKGGVGKSTITFSVAWYLHDIGKRVLIIDMDGQKANISYLACLDISESVLTMQDILMRNIDADKVIQHVAKSDNEGCLDIIPASVSMVSLLQTVKISRMKKVIQDVKKNYDFVFIDVNPSPDWRHALTLSVLDGICIVMLPDILSLEANVGIFESIDEVKSSINSDLRIIGFVINKYDSRTNLSKAVVDKAMAMANYHDTIIFDTKIRKAVSVGESAISHVGITNYAAKSAVSEDMQNLAKEFIVSLQE